MRKNYDLLKLLPEAAELSTVFQHNFIGRNGSEDRVDKSNWGDLKQKQWVEFKLNLMRCEEDLSKFLENANMDPAKKSQLQSALLRTITTEKILFNTIANITTEETGDPIAQKYELYQVWNRLKSLNRLLRKLINALYAKQSQLKQWQDARKLLHSTDWRLRYLARRLGFPLISVGGVLLMTCVFTLSYYYFKVAHLVPAGMVFYSSADALSPSPLDPAFALKFDQHFSVTATSTWEETSVELTQPQTIKRFAIALDLHNGWELEISRLVWFDEQQQILQVTDFLQPEKERWTLFQLDLTDNYQIQPQGLNALKKQFPDLPWSEQLAALPRHEFSNKDSFQRQLKQLKPAPDWQQRAVLRSLFLAPIYAGKGFSHWQVLLSPEENIAGAKKLVILWRIRPR